MVELFIVNATTQRREPMLINYPPQVFYIGRDGAWLTRKKQFEDPKRIDFKAKIWKRHHPTAGDIVVAKLHRGTGIYGITKEPTNNMFGQYVEVQSLGYVNQMPDIIQEAIKENLE